VALDVDAAAAAGGYVVLLTYSLRNPGALISRYNVIGIGFDNPGVPRGLGASRQLRHLLGLSLPGHPR